MLLTDPTTQCICTYKIHAFKTALQSNVLHWIAAEPHLTTPSIVNHQVTSDYICLYPSSAQTGIQPGLALIVFCVSRTSYSGPPACVWMATPLRPTWAPGQVMTELAYKSQSNSTQTGEWLGRFFQFSFIHRTASVNTPSLLRFSDTLIAPIYLLHRS